MINIISSFIFFIVLLRASLSFAQAPEPYGPVPSERQLGWHEMEFYAFVHFNMNTFSNQEWGFGDEPPELFNPTALDCRQWARIAKEAGMKGIIITAKHHDGFCLWPSAFTEHSVKNSPWKNGNGDVLRELRDACDEYGLKMGVYLSPWDRNHAAYARPEYITYFRNQLRELLSNYGDIFEVWFDGANGGTGYYGGANEERQVDRQSYYDWHNTYKIVRELQPDAVLFSDGGPDIRWVGNEEGYANETNWSLLRREEVWPGWPHYQQLRSGHEDGTYWVPAECDVSIRPGWYYHAAEDHKVKTLPELLDIYYKSVGRNGSFLLNFPIDKRGLIHETDSARVMQLAAQLKKDFAHNLATGKKIKASSERKGQGAYAPAMATDGNPNTYWAGAKGVTHTSLTIEMGQATYINRFLVQEFIPLGQRVQAFSVEVLENGQWKKIAEETTIGYKRILRFPDVKATQVRFTVQAAKAAPLISNIALYRAPKVLSAPQISRNKAGIVEVTTADVDAAVYYTTDGREPSSSSARYQQPFEFDGKGLVKAIVIDPQTGERSSVSSADFDISRKSWKLLWPKGNAVEVDAIWDGKPGTAWSQKAAVLPAEWIVDLGAMHRIKGLSYLPDQSRYAAGIISAYKVYVSQDGQNWGEAVAEGEFSNIRNHPVEQLLSFPGRTGRFIKLVAVSVLDKQDQISIAEIGVITD